MLPKSWMIPLGLLVIPVGPPGWSEGEAPAKWVLDCAAIELSAAQPLPATVEEVAAAEGSRLRLVRGVAPELREALLGGTLGQALAVGRAPLQERPSQLHLRLSDGQFSYLQRDADGRLQPAVVHVPEEVDVTLSPAGGLAGEGGKRIVRLQIALRRAVGEGPVAGLPDLAAGPPIMEEQQTDLTLPLAPGEEVLLLLGMDRPKGLLLRLTGAQQPAYSVSRSRRERHPPLQRWAETAVQQQGPGPVETPATLPPAREEGLRAGQPLAGADPFPEVLARVLPAVVRINVEQPRGPRRFRNQFGDFDFFFDPGEDGRIRFRLQRPGQQQEFEFQLPPGQDWQQWLQQNPGWQQWLQPFLPNGAFQNNAYDAGKKPPQVLQVQPPEEEKPNPPPPPPPPVAPPEIRLQFPPQGEIMWGPPFQGGFGEALFAQESAGCIIRPEGYIVTAPGTMLRGAGPIRVTLQDGRAFEAQLVGVDDLSDLAVLKVEAQDLPTVQFGDSDQVQIGESIFSIGHPYGYENTVSRGIISGRNRTLTRARRPAQGLLQIDVPLAPGCSGGPVINLQGQVIGLNYAVFRPAGLGAPLSFALPSNTVAQVAAQLIEKGRVERAWLGVAVGEVSEEMRTALKLPERTGALVQEVVAGSPAEAGGVQVFDVIQQVGDRPIRTANDLVEAIQAHPPGEEIELKLLRNGEEQTLTVKLGPLPPGGQPQPVPPEVRGGREERRIRQPGPPDTRLNRRFQLQVEVRDGRVHLEATNAPLYEVIRQLARATGATLLLDPEVMEQRITVKIADAPLEEALKALAEPPGLVLEKRDDLYILRPR